jgi:RHS repeat-associated protein
MEHKQRPENSGDNSSEYVNVNGTNVVSFNAANNTYSGSKVIKMNQTYPVGPSKSMKVFPGDKVDMEVWSYFETASGWGSTNTGTSGFITTLATAFGGVSGGGGEAGMIYDGVNSAIGTIGLAPNQGSTMPTAYLNYILFDTDYKLLDIGWTPVPSSANYSKQKISISNISVKQPGYIFVYLSYEAESNNWVYFDDLKVTHTKTNVIQYNEYYPFGLSTANSWTREGSSNNFLYNDGNELNLSSEWYEMFYRGYDPAIGRMMQVDPLATDYHTMSPYNYSFNDPVYWNDPSGADPNEMSEDQLFYLMTHWEWLGMPGTYTQWLMAGGAGGATGSAGTTIWNPWWQADDGSPVTGSWMSTNTYEGRAFYNSNYRNHPKVKIIEAVSKGNSWVSETWDWITEHFEISGGYETSVGWQFGGGWKKNLAGYIDLGSSVHYDLNLSNKGSTGGKYKPNEKRNYGIGVSYEGVGIDFKRQVHKGAITNTVSVGVLGLFAIERTYNDDGQLVGWFWGVNPSAKGAIIFGIEVGGKLGFSN